MRGSVRAACRSVLLVALALAQGSLVAQTASQPHSAPDTWYEFLLKKCNPSDFDYGAWLEQRRRALLEDTAKDPHLWYSALLTDALLSMIAVCAKLTFDNRRRMRITAEMMADL